MTTQWSKEEINDLIQVLETEGIVTRENNPTLDSRTSRSIQNLFEHIGYTNFIYIEVASENYFDYSGAVYNTDFFTDQEAREYVKRYVLMSAIEDDSRRIL